MNQCDRLIRIATLEEEMDQLRAEVVALLAECEHMHGDGEIALADYAERRQSTTVHTTFCVLCGSTMHTREVPS